MQMESAKTCAGEKKDDKSEPETSKSSGIWRAQCLKLSSNFPPRKSALDQRLRRVVGESDVFQSVIARFALKLREGQYHFDAPSDLVGLLTTMARTHVAHLARFWQARRRDLRKNRRLDAVGVTEPPAQDRTASSVVARVELLEHALTRLTERDRQILGWRHDGVTWPEISRRLHVPSAEALRKQHERALARVAKEVDPE